MQEPVTAERYALWTAEQRAGIEIVNGLVLAGPSASKRHNRLARLLANTLDAAVGPDWNADTGGDVRLQDVPLTNCRIFTDVVKLTAPFLFEADLTRL
ncbi:hypothetical protein [Dactylosporangium vinaceum]|uniref:Restriction endonuclease domain-containing protein n=1 Tax=Dactylosporangium vinaceum TaxID=53362 RepID=A0ABV5MDB1_9ACTN|nr:hypothetical protein [Dactylosporangium vinaceum]